MLRDGRMAGLVKLQRGDGQLGERQQRAGQFMEGDHWSSLPYVRFLRYVRMIEASSLADPEACRSCRLDVIVAVDTWLGLSRTG